MATIIHGNCGRDVYVDVLNKIRLFGHSQPSRNGPTRDLGHTTIVLDEPFEALPIGIGRNLSAKVAAAEAIQLIGGFSDPEWLVRRAPRMSEYREPSGEFWGAYGRRIGYQVRDAIAKLNADPWSRQAVINLWDPARDNLPEKLDYPCTVALGFSLEKMTSGGRQLNMNVLMRSNDAWLGLPYDMFQFTQLQHTVRRVLGLNHGTYTHTAWSMHLYESDVERSYDVVSDVRRDSAKFDPTGIGELNMTYAEISERARIIALEPKKIKWKPTLSERWYLDVLHS